MPSAWVEHIKDFAKRNNMTYGCALSDPKCSEEYRIKFPKPAKKGKKGKKLDLSKTEFVPLEEAEIDTEPKTKMVVEKKPPAPPAPPQKEPKEPKKYFLRSKDKEEKSKVNLTELWKVGDEALMVFTENNSGFVLGGIADLVKITKVKPNAISYIVSGKIKDPDVKKKGNMTIYSGKFTRDFIGKPSTTLNTSHTYSMFRPVPANFNYRYEYKYINKYEKMTGKGNITTKNISKNITCGMPLSHSMILKMVGDGLSKMYGGSLSGSESDEELTNIFKNLTMRGEADNEPIGMPSVREGVSLDTAIARRPAPAKITGAKRSRKSPEAIGESSSGKKQVTQK